MRLPYRLSSLPCAFAVLLSLIAALPLRMAAQSPLVVQRSPLFVSAPALPLTGTPGSMVSGDLNGDGRPDLITVDEKTGSLSVCLGLGQGSFSAASSLNAGPHPGALLLADLNGDGHLDLVAANTTAGTITILLGLGDGSFQSPVAYKTGIQPALLVAGRFSGQGSLDIAAADNTSARFVLLSNDGEGHLSAPALHALASIPTAIAAADFNGDGHPDLAFANADGTLNIVWGNRGAFQSGPVLHLSNSPLSALITDDFNHDEITDIAVTVPDQKQLIVLTGKGSGNFAAPARYRVSRNPSAILSADFDKDGIPDLLITNQGSNTISVLKGNGDGSFSPALDYVTGRGPTLAIAGDFYGDGHPGVAILNQADASITLPRGNGDGTFAAARAYDVEEQPRSVASGDLAGNHRADLVVANYCGTDNSCTRGSASVLIAGEDGSYHSSSSYPLGAGPVGISLVDLDGDRRLDLLAINRLDKTLSVLSGLGGGSFQPLYTLSLASAPIAFAVADFNHDGRPDLAIIGDCGSSHCSQPGTLELFYGSAGGFRSGPSFVLGYSPSAIAIADLNGDKQLDIVVANRCGNNASCIGSGTASIFWGASTEKFLQGSDLDLGTSPASIALADLSARGTQDLVIAHDSQNTITTMRGNGDGTFQTAVSYRAGASPRSLVVGDFDGDGHLDLAVSNYSDASVTVFYGKGEGALVSSPAVAVSTAPVSLAILSASSKLHAGLVTANTDTTADADSQITVLTNLHPEGIGSTTSTTSIAASPATATVGDAVTLTATVGGNATDGAPTNGSVTFTTVSNDPINDCNGTTSNVVSTGTSTGNNTQFACVTHLLQAPSESVNAAYSGDTTYAASASANPAVVSISAYSGASLGLSASSSSVSLNTNVTFTATLSGLPANGPAPDGTVKFFINGSTTAACSVTISAALTATCSTSALTVNGGAPKATYSGDTDYTVSAATTSVTVHPISAALALSYSANPTASSNVTITVSIPNTTSITPIAPSASPVFTVNGLPPVAGGPLSQCSSLTFAAATFSWSCITSFPNAVSYNIGVSYPSSDANFTLASATKTIPVGKASSLSLGITPSSSSAYVNQTVKYTATLSPLTASPSPTGNIFFKVGGVDLSCSPAAIVSNVATCLSVPYTSSGPVTVQASYDGDDYYSASTPASTTVNITADPTTTTVNSSFPSTSQVNQSVQFSASVAPSSVVTNATGTLNPQGTIAFSATPVNPAGPAVSLCSGQVNNNGAFSCSAAFKTTGTFTVNAAFTSSNTAQFASSQSLTGIPQTVNAAGTPITLSPTSNTLPVNQSMTFTATITFTGTAPTGTVKYIDNSTGATLCPVITLSSATLAADGTVQSCSASFATAGPHAVTATYSGDTLYQASSSVVTPVTVTAGTVAFSAVTPSLTATSSSSVDEQVTFSATVLQASSEFSPATGSTVSYPQGTVTFGYTQGANTVALCNVQLPGTSANIATCPAPYTAAGPYTVTVSYAVGSVKNFSNNSAVSGSAVHTVNRTAVAVMASANPSATSEVYQPVTLSATVTPVGVTDTGLTTPTGTIVFKDGAGNTLCTTPALTATGAVSCTYASGFLNVGSYQITAYFAQDANFLANNSTALPYAVTPDILEPVVTSNSVGNTIVATNPVTFTAAFTPAFPPPANSPVPAGSINFSSVLAGASVTCPITSAAQWNATSGKLIAACTYSSQVGDEGSDVVTAAFASSSANFAGDAASPGAVITENIQNFTISHAASTSTVVYVTQGYSTNPQTTTEILDPFAGILNPSSSAAAVAVTTASGLGDSITMTCSTTLSNTLAKCIPLKTPLVPAQGSSITSASTSGFDFATNSLTPVGQYTVSVEGVDSTVTNLHHTYPNSALQQTPITLYVIPQAGAITLSPGFSGTETVTFTSANQLSFAANACPTILYSQTGAAGSWQQTTTSQITCTASNSTVTGSQAQAIITIQTQGSGTAAAASARGETVTLASLAGGVTLFAGMAWFARRRSGKRSFFRFLGLLILLVGIGHAIGCGGGGFTPNPPTSSGKTPTPTGYYLIQVTGTDSNNVAYYAVISLNLP